MPPATRCKRARKHFQNGPIAFAVSARVRDLFSVICGRTATQGGLNMPGVEGAEAREGGAPTDVRGTGTPRRCDRRPTLPKPTSNLLLRGKVRRDGESQAGRQREQRQQGHLVDRGGQDGRARDVHRKLARVPRASCSSPRPAAGATPPPFWRMALGKVLSRVLANLRNGTRNGEKRLVTKVCSPTVSAGGSLGRRGESVHRLNDGNGPSTASYPIFRPRPPLRRHARRRQDTHSRPATPRSRPAPRRTRSHTATQY